MPLLNVHILTFCVRGWALTIGCVASICHSYVAFLLSFTGMLKSCGALQWFSLCWFRIHIVVRNLFQYRMSCFI